MYKTIIIVKLIFLSLFARADLIATSGNYIALAKGKNVKMLYLHEKDGKAVLKNSKPFELFETTRYLSIGANNLLVGVKNDSNGSTGNITKELIYRNEAYNAYPIRDFKKTGGSNLAYMPEVLKLKSLSDGKFALWTYSGGNYKSALMAIYDKSFSDPIYQVTTSQYLGSPKDLGNMTVSPDIKLYTKNSFVQRYWWGGCIESFEDKDFNRQCFNGFIAGWFDNNKVLVNMMAEKMGGENHPKTFTGVKMFTASHGQFLKKLKIVSPINNMKMIDKEHALINNNYIYNILTDETIWSKERGTYHSVGQNHIVFLDNKEQIHIIRWRE